jgi:ABC-2 type transport system permease protein
VINSSYTNVSSSFFIDKFQRSIEPMLIAPLRSSHLVLGFIIGGIYRGLLVAFIVTAIGHWFSDSPLTYPMIYVTLIILASTLFGCLGFLNALWAKKFNHINIIPNFILTPLIYLGGVFHPLSTLSEPWQTLSHLNPIAWIVSGLHYAILGRDALSIELLMVALLMFNATLFLAARYCCKRRIGFKI